jgi:hypothetical protein
MDDEDGRCAGDREDQMYYGIMIWCASLSTWHVQKDKEVCVERKPEKDKGIMRHWMDF